MDTNVIHSEILKEERALWKRLIIISIIAIINSFAFTFLLSKLGLYAAGISPTFNGITSLLINLNLISIDNRELYYWSMYSIYTLGLIVMMLMKMEKKYTIATIVYVMVNITFGFIFSLVPLFKDFLIVSSVDSSALNMTFSSDLFSTNLWLPISYDSSKDIQLIVEDISLIESSPGSSFTFYGTDISFIYYDTNGNLNYIFIPEAEINITGILPTDDLKIVITPTDNIYSAPLRYATGNTAYDYEFGSLIAAAISCGLIMGIGASVVYSNGGSTAGFDPIAYYISIKRPNGKNLGVYILYWTGINIIFFSIINDYFVYNYVTVDYTLETHRPFLNVIFGPVVYGSFTFLIVFTFTINLLFPRNKRMQVLIYTKKGEQIRNELLHQKWGRGFSIVNIQGGYKKEPGQMISSICNYMEVYDLVKLVWLIDHDAFITTNDIRNVYSPSFSGKIKKMNIDYNFLKENYLNEFQEYQTILNRAKKLNITINAKNKESLKDETSVKNKNNNEKSNNKTKPKNE